MPNYASIQLCGHVGKAEELKYTPQGTAVLRFSLAVNTGYGDKKAVSWYSCQLWAKQAESLAPYIIKGKPLLVIGEPSIREYTDSSGNKRQSFDVRVRDVVLLGDGGRREQVPQDQQQDAAPSQESSEIPF